MNTVLNFLRGYRIKELLIISLLSITYLAQMYSIIEKKKPGMDKTR